jgi:hypothetical protein
VENVEIAVAVGVDLNKTYSQLSNQSHLEKRKRKKTKTCERVPSTHISLCDKHSQVQHILLDHVFYFRLLF